MDVALSNSVSETEDVEGLDTEDEYSDDESSFGTKSNLMSWLYWIRQTVKRGQTWSRKYEESNSNPSSDKIRSKMNSRRD